MKLTIESIGTTVSARDEIREPHQRPTEKPGLIYVDDHNGEYGPAEYTPKEARELAAALLHAVDVVEESATYPVVTAGELRAGDVLNDDAYIYVDEVRKSGERVNVRWASGADSWMNSYRADNRINLARRGPEA